MEDRAEEQGLLDAAGVEGRVLLMKDGGEPVGYVVVALEETVLHLRKISQRAMTLQNVRKGRRCLCWIR